MIFWESTHDSGLLNVAQKWYRQRRTPMATHLYTTPAHLYTMPEHRHTMSTHLLLTMATMKI